MKRLLILIALLALILPVFAVAQVAPTGDKAMLAGPVYGEDGGSFRWGVAKRVGTSKVWIAGFGQFGNSVEAFFETTILFPITSKFHVGPVAGFGADWSSEPGTETISAENYLIYTAGGAGTYEIKAKYGLWGYFKYQGAPNDANLYKSGVTGGVGLYYRL